MFTNAIRAVDLIHDTINKEGRITIYGDYDVDGINSVLCYKDFFNIIGYKHFKCVEYTARTHNIDKKVISEVLANNSSLCLIADTGSSDLNELVGLSKLASVIFADHHHCQFDFEKLPENVIPVNPTVLDNYPHLSGACVVYEICIAYLSKYRQPQLEYGYKALTYYAFSALYADSVYSDNAYCRSLYTRASRSMLPIHFNHLKYFNVSKRFSLFSFAPPLNACFRNGVFHVLNRLFLKDTYMLSIDRENFLQEMTSVREYARVVSDVLMEKASTKVIGEFVLADLSGLLNQTIPNKYIWDNKGLVANKIAGKYKKCCVCIVSVGNHYVLSLRDYYNRDMYRIFSTIYNVGGHSSAFGGELSFQEAIDLPNRLKFFSKLTEPPTQITEVPFNHLTNSEIISIAEENEFRHEKDLVLVRVPMEKFERTWTPESFKDRYEQLALDLDSKVYIKLEEFARSEPSVLVHFFKANRLSGALVENKLCD